MKHQFSLGNLLFVACLGLACLSMYLGVILRSHILESKLYSLIADLVFLIFLMLLGLFCVLPIKVKERLILDSWLRNYARALLQILQPGLGIWAFLASVTIIIYIVFWAF